MEECSHDACAEVKKVILSTKKIIEEAFQDIARNYPELSIEKTFIEQEGKIMPKIGIFPSSIITLPASDKLLQPLKIMIFINVLDAQEEEVELTYGWIFGPGAEEEKEEIYLKLLAVVSTLKEEQGSLYRGKLEAATIQLKVKETFAQIILNYRQIMKDLGTADFH